MLTMINLKKIFIKKLVEIIKFCLKPFPKISYFYRIIRDSRPIKDKPKVTKFGFKFLGHAYMVGGEFEPQETELAIQIFKKIDVFIDVGANVGFYSCLAMSYGKYTIAIEPIQKNLQYLMQNIKVNAFDNSIEIFPVALSDKSDIIDIYGSGTAASVLKGWAGISEQSVSIVPSLVLDNLLFQRFPGKQLFVKVDIEGAEKLMLQGATQLLSRIPKPIWLIEIMISEHQPNGMKINPNLMCTFNIFWDSGYIALTADKNLREINYEEINSIVQTGINTLETHNFLFLETKQRNQIYSS